MTSSGLSGIHTSEAKALRAVMVQFTICPLDFGSGSVLSPSLASGYSALTYLPYPVPPAVLRAIGQVMQRALGRTTTRAIWVGIRRAIRTAIRRTTGRVVWPTIRQATWEPAGTAAVHVAPQTAQTIAREVILRTTSREIRQAVRPVVRSAAWRIACPALSRASDHSTRITLRTARGWRPEACGSRLPIRLDIRPPPN